ncbi:MAG: hypothetical protein LGB67_03025 [Sulfurovum sp.]|nr:hypothetical protein [Sulfurovum sp.]
MKKILILIVLLNSNGIAKLDYGTGTPAEQLFDIGNSELANDNTGSFLEPLYQEKAKLLQEASDAKKAKLQGLQQPTNNNGVSITSQILFGADGDPNTSDSFLPHLGSATQSLLANTADFFTTVGSYGLKKLSDTTDSNFFTQEDYDTTTNFFDKFSGKNADKVWGYDRTRLNEQQSDVMTNLAKGDYASVAKSALIASPGTIVDFLPVILSMLTDEVTLGTAYKQKEREEKQKELIIIFVVSIVSIIFLIIIIKYIIKFTQEAKEKVITTVDKIKKEKRKDEIKTLIEDETIKGTIKKSFEYSKKSNINELQEAINNALKRNDVLEAQKLMDILKTITDKGK